MHIVACQYNVFPNFHFIQLVGAVIQAIADSKF